MFLFQGRQKSKGYRLPGEASFRKLWENITVIEILVVIGLQYKNIRWNIFFDLPKVCPWVVIVLAAMFWILLLPYQVCLPAWGLFYFTVKVFFHIVPPEGSCHGRPAVFESGQVCRGYSRWRSENGGAGGNTILGNVVFPFLGGR